MSSNETSRDPARAFRVSDPLWQSAKRVAHARNESLSAVLRRALIHYVRRHEAELSASQRAGEEGQRTG